MNKNARRTFSLVKKNKVSNNKTDFLKNHHEIWKKHLKDNKGTFFMLYEGFRKYLPELTTGALRLYLYYGFNSQNATGESWHGIDRIANELDTTTRSINSWNTELEDLGLIYRSSSSNHSSSTTYLLPYSDYTVQSEELFSEFIKRYEENKYLSDYLGKISKVYHFFQWRKGEKEDVYDKPLNMVVVEFEKEYLLEKKIETDIRKRSFIFKLRQGKETNLNLDNIYMSEDMQILLFEPPNDILDIINLEGVDIDIDKIDIRGILVHTHFNMLKSEVMNDIWEEIKDEVNFNNYEDYKSLKE